MSDRQGLNMTADEYRLAQAEKLLALFEGAHGYPASTAEELEAWVASAEGRAALVYDHAPDGTIIPDLPPVAT